MVDVRIGRRCVCNAWEAYVESNIWREGGGGDVGTAEDLLEEEDEAGRSRKIVEY